MNARAAAIAKLGLIVGLGVSAAAASTQAQAWPDRRITIIPPSTAGGPSDVALRPLAQELSTALGQPVIVDNKAGAGVTLAGHACAQAAPDGYLEFHLAEHLVPQGL